jgi:tetratricopeptide (TPR) repeat protein
LSEFCCSKGEVAFIAWVDGKTEEEAYDSVRITGMPIGTGDIIPGLDILLRTMRQGEVCLTYFRPLFAYGSAGKSPDVPPNASIRMRVELISFRSGPPAPGKVTLNEALDEAAVEKEMGNACMRNGEVEKAKEHYELGLEYLKVARFETDVQHDRCKVLREALAANAAAACLKLERWTDATDHATVALTCNPSNVKALHRRATGFTRRAMLRDAKRDLHAAIKLEPNNRALREALETVKERQASSTAEQKKLFSTGIKKARAYQEFDDDEEVLAELFKGPRTAPAYTKEELKKKRDPFGYGFSDSEDEDE